MPASSEIDASIAAKADFEYLYDKPYEDRRKVRVAGPFTVESISPHRVLDVDENDELIDNVAEARLGYGETQDFANVILEHLRSSGVQQAHKEDRIAFSSITPWPGDLVCAEGRYIEGGDGRRTAEKRAAIFIGPEFGTVARPDLGRCRPGSGGRRLRRADCLRVQLRGPRVRVQEARSRSDPQVAHECRSPHGWRPEEHRQGEPVRHLRGARHRRPPGRGRRR